MEQDKSENQRLQGKDMSLPGAENLKDLAPVEYCWSGHSNFFKETKKPYPLWLSTSL